MLTGHEAKIYVIIEQGTKSLLKLLQERITPNCRIYLSLIQNQKGG